MPRAPPWREKQSQYLQRCSDRMLSRNTLRSYGLALTYALRFAKRSNWTLNPAKIEPAQVRELYYHMLDTGISTNTQKFYIFVLLNFLHFCGNRHCEEVNFRISVSRIRVNWLTEMEVSEVLTKATYPPTRGMLVLMAYCGLRREEVSSLRRSNVRMNQLLVTGKGRKERAIPLDRPFWNAMKIYTDWASTRPMTDFFVSYQRPNGRMHGYAPNGISNAVLNHSVLTGITFSSHTLRRSFGRHLYKHGCPLAELQTLMGHASMEMTIKYLGIGQDDITHAMGFRPDYIRGLK